MTNEQLIALNKKELTDKARSLGIINPSSLRKDELVKAIVKAEKKLEKAKERQQNKATQKKEPVTKEPVSKEAQKPARINSEKSPKSAAKTVEKTPEPVKVELNGNGKHTAKTKPVPVASNGTTASKSPSKNGNHKPVKAVERDLDLDDDDDLGDDEVVSTKLESTSTTTNAKSPKDLPSGYQKDRVVVAVIDPYWLHCYWELTQQSVQRAEAAMGPDWHSCKPILRLLDVSAQDTTSTAESIVKDIELHGG